MIEVTGTGPWFVQEKGKPLAGPFRRRWVAKAVCAMERFGNFLIGF